MRKVLARVLLLSLALLMLCITVFADAAESVPSVQIEIEGLYGRHCYATLLGPNYTCGPYQAWDENKARGINYYYKFSDYYEAKAAFSAFGAFEDPDGYSFYGKVYEITDGVLTWDFPPDPFKLALWFPATGKLLVASAASCFAVDSRYRVTLTENGLGTPEQIREHDVPILSFLFRLLVTLAIELGLAMLFGYGLRPVLIVNLITQIGLNLLLMRYVQQNGISGQGYTITLALLELAVFGIEAVAYTVLLPPTCPEEPGTGRVILYAFLANVLSFIAGLILSLLFPMSF